MDLTDLRFIEAIAATGGVSRAAERLNCVQSNVTQRLKRLEETLGGPLFQRTSRGMVPTAAGRVAVDYVRRLLALSDEARRAVAAAISGAGPLAIGAMETATAVRLPPVLAHFHGLHPEVEIALATGTSEEIVRDVLARRHDIGLVAIAVDHPDLVSEEVFEEQLVEVHDGTLRGVDKLLVFRAGCSYRRIAEEWRSAIGRPPRRIMELGTLDGILGCVAAGMGRAVLPRAVLTHPTVDPSLRFDAIDHPLARVPVRLVRRRDAPDLPTRDAFTALLKEMTELTPATRAA